SRFFSSSIIIMVSLANFWSKANQLVQKIPTNALNTAYQSAVNIQTIENDHFQGKIISPEVEGGQCVYEYYKSALDRELATINLNLTQLKISKFFKVNVTTSPTNESEEEEITRDSDVLEKLRFIETVIGKYRKQQEEVEVRQAKTPITPLKGEKIPPITPSPSSPNENEQPPNNLLEEIEREIEQINPLRRRQYTAEYEQEVVEKLRRLRLERKISIRILLTLLIVPLLVQIVTKNLIYAPLIDNRTVDKVAMSEIKISEEVGARFLTEYRKFKDTLDIKRILNPDNDSSKAEEEFQERVRELLIEAGYETRRGLVNLLADGTALLTFAGIIYVRRRDCQTLVSFLSYNFAGLNVVTKVFIFILLTDMFVGFHSAEGWDVLLVKTFEHLGIPENRSFNGIFIATIPVLMDSTFKLLIFNYFTRTSPASVAILEKMNQ
ncbi:MAG: hypothetical protein AB4058_08380, partial [Microcystaceae cyanobacterium]